MRKPRAASRPEPKTFLKRNPVGYDRGAIHVVRPSAFSITFKALPAHPRAIDRLQHPEEAVNAEHLAAKLGNMATDAADLIVNTYRPHSSTRILELFGRKFDYRNRENLTALLATADFGTPRLVGSGNMYDVLVYEKSPS